jgi:hypothetical protein
MCSLSDVACKSVSLSPGHRWTACAVFSQFLLDLHRPIAERVMKIGELSRGTHWVIEEDASRVSHPKAIVGNAGARVTRVHPCMASFSCDHLTREFYSSQS